VCGIAGYFHTRGTRTGPGLDSSLKRLAHRGPDETGTFMEGALALGQTRLSIIDLTGGRQPLFSRDGQLVLVANGEIYNFVELRQELEEKGHHFLTGSDSEVIIHCYAEYGDDFIEHLHGMFAFALYDRKRTRLILARDRLGIKPLFMVRQPDGVAFASELKALLPLLDHKPDINPLGLAQYLQNQFTTGATTILEGVERILPGEAVSVQKGEEISRWRYWSAAGISPRLISFEEALEEFDRLMETVMIEHMRSDVPFGLFLSGGVDSAILLALLSKYKEEPVRTFSVGFPGTSLTDELPLARAMARRFNSRHTEITPTREEIFRALPLTVWAADDLMRDYANLPTSILSAAAGKELKVVFSGEGGDEVFGGYGRYRTSPLELKVKSLFAPGSGGFRTRGTVRGKWRKILIKEEFRPFLDLARHPFVEAWSRTPARFSSLQRMQYTDLVTALPDNLLVKADRMMMAWGLEGRVPFLDHRVVQFGLSLPDHLKIRSGEGKVFLKRWAARFLPEDHLQRPKKGFHVPVGEWLSPSFLDKLAQVLPDHPAVAPWFEQAGLRELIRRCPESSVNSRMLWSILQFAIWHRLVLENDGERPAASEDPFDLIR